jgi:hypothetical protein
MILIGAYIFGEWIEAKEKYIHILQKTVLALFLIVTWWWLSEHDGDSKFKKTPERNWISRKIKMFCVGKELANIF